MKRLCQAFALLLSLISGFAFIEPGAAESTQVGPPEGFASAPAGAFDIAPAPAPLYRDPIFDGAADPSVVYEGSEGLGVYASDDGLEYQRNGTILSEPGKRTEDGVRGGHAGIAVVGDRALSFYFTHPDRTPGYKEWRTAAKASLDLKSEPRDCRFLAMPCSLLTGQNHTTQSSLFTCPVFGVHLMVHAYNARKPPLF